MVVWVSPRTRRDSRSRVRVLGGERRGVGLRRKLSETEGVGHVGAREGPDGARRETEVVVLGTSV